VWQLLAWLNPVVIPGLRAGACAVLSYMAARLTVLLCVCASAFDICEIKNYFTFKLVMQNML